MKHPKIHPDISLYWEERGCQIEPRLDSYALANNATTHTMLFDAVKDDAVIEATVALVFADETPTIYYDPDGREWNESEIIRVMKLKAFL
jgi:hypothetical protein